jgi:hypothetical protein
MGLLCNAENGCRESFDGAFAMRSSKAGRSASAALYIQNKQSHPLHQNLFPRIPTAH